MLLNVLILTKLSFGQEEVQTIKIEKAVVEQDFHPQIEGVFDGEISILTLASPNGIITNIGWEIESFKMTFITGRDMETITINSNVIPEETILTIVKYSMNEQIFFTDIFAYDQTNTRHLLKSMILIPIPNDEK